MATDAAGAPAPPPPPPAAPHPLPFRLLPAGETSWDPSEAAVALNVRLDGCIVPSEASAEGARIAYSHAVVIDDFIDEPTRQQLLDFLLWGEAGPPPAATGDEQQQQQQQQQGQQQQEQPGGAAGAAVQLPAARWERRTADMAGGAPTWGVRPHVLAELSAGQLPALREVGARLAKLYPECEIAHLPSDAIQLAPEEGAAAEQDQQPPAAQQQQQKQLGEQAPPAKRSRRGDGSPAAELGGSGNADGTEPAEGGGPAADCACFVANAAVAGDSFRYHVDADPTSFPDGSPWHAAYGDFFNGEPGKPLLASLLIYLDADWRRDWGADTLLLDAASDTGVFVVPKPRRALLLNQDILHRVSAPQGGAGPRPRYSLVWKLALLPRQPGQALCLARPEWGPPASIGSAARVDAVKRRLADERRRAGGGGGGVG